MEGQRSKTRSKEKNEAKKKKASGSLQESVPSQEKKLMNRCSSYQLSSDVMINIVNCKHIIRMTIGENHSVVNSNLWKCQICGTEESVQACLSCPFVSCGRYMENHAAEHARTHDHPIVIDVKDLYVYCYKCDDYVLNHDRSDDITRLRETLQAMQCQMITGSTRSGHTVRSAAITSKEGKERQQRIKDELHQSINKGFSAVWQCRFARLRRGFKAWRRYHNNYRFYEVTTSTPIQSDDDEVSAIVAIDNDNDIIIDNETDDLTGRVDIDVMDIPTTSTTTLSCFYLTPPTRTNEPLPGPSSSPIYSPMIRDCESDEDSLVGPARRTKRRRSSLHDDLNSSNSSLSTSPEPQRMSLKLFQTRTPANTTAPIRPSCVVTNSSPDPIISSPVLSTPMTTRRIKASNEALKLATEALKSASISTPRTSVVCVTGDGTKCAKFRQITAVGSPITSNVLVNSAQIISKKRPSSNELEEQVESETKISSKRLKINDEANENQKSPPTLRSAVQSNWTPLSPRRSSRLNDRTSNRDDAPLRKRTTRQQVATTKAQIIANSRTIEKIPDDKKSKTTKEKTTVKSKTTVKDKTKDKTEKLKKVEVKNKQSNKKNDTPMNGPQRPSRVRTSRANVANNVNMENSSWGQIMPGVTGLKNLGNTCYLNSIIQVLGHIPEFRQCLAKARTLHYSTYNKSYSSDDSPPSSNNKKCRSALVDRSVVTASKNNSPRHQRGLPGGGAIQPNQDSVIISPPINIPTRPARKRSNQKKTRSSDPNKKTRSTDSLCHELNDLYCNMWSGKWKHVAPNKLLTSVWNSIPSFRGYCQQDAQEFLSLLLSQIVNELDSKHASDQVSQIVKSVFKGVLHSQVECLECGNKSTTTTPFCDLSLDFPKRYHSSGSSWRLHPCNLTEMLEKFTEPERLGRVYDCTECNRSHNDHQGRSLRRQSRRTGKRVTDATKTTKIFQLPKILNFHLKRFRWSGKSNRDSKIAVKVDFPSELDIGEHCVNSNKETNKYMGNTLYDLRAVVIHHGRGFGSGHYTAYCWNEHGKFWVNCNDAKLELSSIEDVMRSHAYILFYSLRHQKQDDNCEEGGGTTDTTAIDNPCTSKRTYKS